MKRSGPTSVVRVIALAALVLVVASCTGGSGSRTGTGTHTSTSAAAAAPPAKPDRTASDVKVLPAVAPKSTTVDGTIRTADGRDRTYHLYVPSTVVPGARSGPKVPLLVAMHGGLGWGVQFERTSGFNGIAEANGFVVVYPDGIGVGPSSGNRTWNSGACCGAAQREQVDDVGFVRALVDRLRSQYPIDPKRTFATGHSNGGMQAYRLACELSDEIVAVGVQSSALEVDGCDPARPVSLLHIHGTADENVPLAGGVGPNAISGVSFNPPMDGAKTIAAADRCSGSPTRSADPTNADLLVTTWASCADGTAVEFMTVTGAPHAWMGSHPIIERPGNTPYPDLDSSAVIWKFLANHPRT